MKKQERQIKFKRHSIDNVCIGYYVFVNGIQKYYVHEVRRGSWNIHEGDSGIEGFVDEVSSYREAKEWMYL